MPWVLVLTAVKNSTVNAVSPIFLSQILSRVPKCKYGETKLKKEKSNKNKYKSNAVLNENELKKPLK